MLLLQAKNLRLVVYYRAGERKDGKVSPDLAAQRAAVESYGWFLPFEETASFTEIEPDLTGRRPQLLLAISEAKRLGSDILIADAGLLLSDTYFTQILFEAERSDKVRFLAYGFSKLGFLDTATLLGLARSRYGQISERTAQGLAGAKVRGVKLGSANGTQGDVARAAWSAKTGVIRAKHFSIIEKIRRTGITSLSGIADTLNSQGVKTPRGCGNWSAIQVSRIIGPVRPRRKSAD